MLWSQTEAVSAQHPKSLNDTELFTLTQLALLCEFHFDNDFLIKRANCKVVFHKGTSGL